MKNKIAGVFIAITLCIMILVPASSLAETITVLSEDFESSPSTFVRRTTNFNPLYNTSEIIQASAKNRVWQIALGEGATTGYLSVAGYTENYDSYIIPSNAEDVIYEADVWIVNNNQMPDKVLIGMNFGYRDRIMRIRFLCDTKEILYQWITGKSEVSLSQTFAYGKWNKVKVVYHTASETCDVYINGIVQLLGFSTVTWTDANVSVNGHNPLMKFNLNTKTNALPLEINKPVKANFDNAKVSYIRQAVPPTGDTSHLGLWIIIVILSVAGTSLLTWIIRNRRS